MDSFAREVTTNMSQGTRDQIEFEGAQWVAMQDGELLAVGEKIEDLLPLIDQQEMPGRTIIRKVNGTNGHKSISPPSHLPTNNPATLKLIAGGESATVEFSSHFPWQGIKEGLPDLFKTIIALIYNQGGTVIVGVNDDGVVCGLKEDLEANGNSLFRLEQRLRSHLRTHIGIDLIPFLEITFEQVCQKTIAVINIPHIRQPIPVRHPFYVRLGKRTYEPRRFADAVKAIDDWSTHSPDELQQAISGALTLNMVKLARFLAAEGVRLYPNHAHFEQVARVIAPPVARVVPRRRNSTLRKSSDWLQKNSSPYRGKWVAVRDGKLLGASQNIEDILPLRGEGEDVLNTLIHRVL